MVAMSLGVPSSWDRTLATSCRVRTTGSRFPPFGADDLIQPGEIDGEHLLVEEEDRGQGLVLRGSADVPACDKVIEEHLHLPCAHVERMALPVEDDVPLDPTHVGFLRSQAVAAYPDRVLHAVKK